VGTRATSDELGFDPAHRPGALTRYFAKRWLKEPSAKGEQLVAWLLEAALGRNALYFIERTKEYVDAWGGRGEVVPVDAFDGFLITGDPVEDTIIPHAVLVWTCMNDRPWPEEVYHDWLDKLLAAGSAEAAYLAASLWPAHDLMAKVAYRPAGWLVYRGQLDAEAERLILTEMLRGAYRPSLYGSLEYDDLRLPERISISGQYIDRHGFTHPICGLVRPIELENHYKLRNRIQEALAAPSWSEEVKGAAMLLYLSLKTFKNLSITLQELLDTLEQNLSKLEEKHINIINFHMDKIEKIDYNLIKDYVNYIIILYDKIIGEINLSIKMLSKYISIGLKTNDILYIGEYLKMIIFNLMQKEKEKLESWIKNQEDDLRIKDILMAIYLSKKIDRGSYYVKINEELKNDDIYQKIEYIYGKMNYFDKIKLFIEQANKYFFSYDSNKISDFIYYILNREAKININYNFIEDYEKIINSWHPNRHCFTLKHIFLDSNHIGLYLYYEILKGWEWVVLYFEKYIKEKNEINLYLRVKNKIIENLHRERISDAERINLYLNKIEINNLPYEEIKCELAIKLVNMIKNNYNKVLKHLKDERKMRVARKIILSNISFVMDELRDTRLTNLLNIDVKSHNMEIY